MDACAHECTTARVRADTGDRRRPSQTDRPSAATRTRHRLPHRAVGRRCRRDPLSAAPARRRVPGVRPCERLLSGWVGFGRGRGPPCQGRLAAVGRPAPATNSPLPRLLIMPPPPASGRERPTAAWAPLLANSSSSSTSSSPPRRLRAPRKVPRLPSLSAPVPCLALLPHHLFGETPQPRKRRRRNSLAVFGSALPPAAVVVLIRRGASRPVIVGAVL